MLADRVWPRAPNEAAATSTAAGTVTALVARADAGRFPRIELQLRAEDVAGQPVSGLVAGDFEITEDGERVIPLLIANNYRPRVIFALDYSLSVPGPIRDGYRQLVLDLAAPLFSDHGAEVMVTAIGGSDNDLPFVDNLVDLASQIDDDVLGAGSAIYGELAAMTRRPASAIVAISDFDNFDDEITPALLDRVRASPPVLLLGAGDVLQATVRSADHYTLELPNGQSIEFQAGGYGPSGTINRNAIGIVFSLGPMGPPH